MVERSHGECGLYPRFVLSAMVLGIVFLPGVENVVIGG